MQHQRQYHLQVEPGEVGGYVLLPGDPGRCARIAERLDGARQVAANREFTTYTGSLGGAAVSVTSTGIGGPSTAIAVEELIKLGATTLVRVGTCGALDPELGLGDIVVAHAAARGEGTSAHYAPAGFPAVADLEVVVALREAAEAAGHRCRVGVVLSNDAFYAEMEPERFPLEAEIRAALVRLGESRLRGGGDGGCDPADRRPGPAGPGRGGAHGHRPGGRGPERDARPRAPAPRTRRSTPPSPGCAG